jgi:hypothetical protein
MDQWATIVEDFDTTPNTTVWEASIVTTTPGKARVGAINTNRSIYRTNSPSWFDSYFEIEVVTLGSGTLAVGGYLRGTVGGERYSINMDIANIYVDTVATGAISTVGFTMGGLPGILRGEVQGDIIRTYWKGNLISSVQNGLITTPGVPALYMFASVAANAEISRWEAGPLGPNYHSPCRFTSCGPAAIGMR